MSESEKVAEGELVPADREARWAVAGLKEIPESVGPECRRLAAGLRDLFVELQVSVRRYAVQKHRTPSTVTRYLNGTAVAPPDFIDALLTDVGRVMKRPVSKHVISHVQHLQETALRATSEKAWELQDLRRRLLLADNELRRAEVVRDTLAAELDRKEQRIAELEGEVRRLELIAPVAHGEHGAELDQELKAPDDLRSERDHLLRTVAHLQEELEQAKRRALDAERRCTVLEHQLAEVEGDPEQPDRDDRRAERREELERGGGLRVEATEAQEQPSARASGGVEAEDLWTAKPRAGGQPGLVSLPDLLGIEDLDAIDIETLWARRDGRDFLRVPIAVTGAGQPVLLDIKESAELGMGPHGLCVGATGAGKSELLRTIVLALAATHSPKDLALFLVDCRRGATFSPFAELPHVAGLVGPVDVKTGISDRVRATLLGELTRRRRALEEAGNAADIAEFAALRETTPDLEPLSRLLVVIDELDALLMEDPAFIDTLLLIGRTGRALGVHLLLSSQSLDKGRLKGLDTYLSYRLALRTLSADESMAALDAPDAFRLPRLPGSGILAVDSATHVPFRAGFVSGSLDGRGPSSDRRVVGGPGAVGAARGMRPGRGAGPTVLRTMVDRLSAAAPATRRIWLPPLPGTLTLDDVMGSVETTSAVGRHGEGLWTPMGVIDMPGEQWQGPWWLDLTKAGGHVAVIGGPRSGKTTLLRTLGLSLALTRTPRDVAMYGLDLAGGGLHVLKGLPHVGGIAGRVDRERASRTVAQVQAMLAEREELFREQGIDSVGELRQLRAQGGMPQLASTDVVLLIDGFGALRDEFEELDDAVTDLLKRGGGYGIHVVAGILHWNDVRVVTQSMFGTRVELRLSDPEHSGIDRRLAATLPPDVPGRVLTEGRLFAQVALPRTDGRKETADLGTAVTGVVRVLSAGWKGEVAPPVRVLPARLPVTQLPSVVAEPHRVPIGVDQDALEPVLLDLFDSDQHFLILGDNECGKTNLLKLISARLIERYSDQELVFGVFDPRRGLRGTIPEPYRGGYAHNAKLGAGLAGGIASELEKRMPETADPDAVADDPSFKGPRIVILVDDYDILTTAGQQPLAPFLPYVPSAQDIGLHFVITRRVSGASRALYEPLLQTLRETGTATLVMTGDRSEGQLLPGLYPSAQQPGRGTLVRRGRPHKLIQTALLDETEQSA